MLSSELISISPELILRAAKKLQLEEDTTPMVNSKSSRTELHLPQSLSMKVTTMDLSKRLSNPVNTMLSSRPAGMLMMLRTMPSESIVQLNSPLFNQLTLLMKLNLLLPTLISTLVYLLLPLKLPQLPHGMHIRVLGLTADTSSKWPKVAALMIQLPTRTHSLHTQPVLALSLIQATLAQSQDQVETSYSLATANWKKDQPLRPHATTCSKWRILQDSPTDGVVLFHESEGFYNLDGFK